MSFSPFKILKKEELWNYVNLFNNLNKVSLSFITLLRYYPDDCTELVISLVKVFDFELKAHYPRVEQTLQYTLEQVKN